MATEEEARDLAIFQLLVTELPEADPKATERRIKNKLRRSALGDFDAAHLEQLRALHDDLRKEFKKFDCSEYVQLTFGNVASIGDWDTSRMAHDFHERYPSVSESDMNGIVGFALYFYYLR
jgi:hypothetical protein